MLRKHPVQGVALFFSLPNCSGLLAEARLPVPTMQPYPKSMSVCSTEPRIEACQAEEGRITGFALAHSLRITVGDFHVGLRGSINEFIFIKDIWDIDFPLFTGLIYES